MILPIWDGEEWMLTKPMRGSEAVYSLLAARKTVLEKQVLTAPDRLGLAEATRKLQIVEQQLKAIS